MLKDHLAVLEANFKNKTTYAFSDVKESLETLEELLNQFITHSGFSNLALQINENDVTFMNFGRITKGNTEKQIPKFEINDSVNTESDWIEFSNVPAFKYVGIGQPFSFEIIESSVLEAQGLMQSVYEDDKYGFYPHVKDMIIKGLLFNYKRQPKEGMAEKLIDRNLETAIKGHDLIAMLNLWFDHDTYIQERIKAIGAVAINHIHSNGYFNEELKAFSDKSTNGGFFQYSYIASALTKEQYAQTLNLARTNIYDAIVYVQMGLSSVESLIVEGENKERILGRIEKMGALEFTNIIKSRSLYRAFLDNDLKVFSVFFTLAILFDVDLVARYSRLINMVMEAEANDSVPSDHPVLDRLNGFIRLYVVFGLLVQPMSFKHLENRTMLNYLTNAQQSADDKDSMTYNLENFNRIIDCYTPVMLNSQAKKYELQQFIQQGRLPIFFNFEASNTIFTNTVFDGVKINDATVRIVSNSLELLKLSEAMDVNLNFLAEPAKLMAKFIFSIEWNGKAYAMAFDVYDENRLVLNVGDIAVPNKTELHEIIQTFTQKLVKNRMYIKNSYKAEYV